MAYTTHPNQIDSKRGVRAGLIGLAVVLFAAVAALGYSVVSHDTETAPVVVDFPTVDEMRAENQIIRDQLAAAEAARSLPSNDDMRAESIEIRKEVAAAMAAAAANDPGSVAPTVDEPQPKSEGPVQRPTRTDL